MTGGFAEELARAHANGVVGSRLVSASERVRVWHIHLEPGERLPFHCHVLDYFWTTVAAGVARTVLPDGSFADHSCEVGESEHIFLRAGERIVHALENVGDTPLGFVTVELLDSANPPLPI